MITSFETCVSCWSMIKMSGLSSGAYRIKWRSHFRKSSESCNPSLGCHRGRWGGPSRPIGVSWEAVGENDEGMECCPGCIHTAVDRDVLPGRLLLLIDVFPPSLAQDLLPGPRFVSKAGLITIIDEMWLVLQLVLQIKGLITT